MDKDIVVAIITALTAILSPIIIYIIKRICERSQNKDKMDVPIKLSRGKRLIIEIAFGGLIGLVIGFLFAKNIYKNNNDTQLTLVVPFKMTSYFIPSGWMGDGKNGTEFIKLETARQAEFYPNGKDQLSIRIKYIPGPEGFAGIYWQYPENNWGDEKGIRIKRANYISFWSKGEEGGEVVEFKSGGIRDGKYKDSYAISLGRIMLSNSWTRFTLDLNNQNLSNVIGAFAWIASADDNPNGLIFYLDEIWIE